MRPVLGHSQKQAHYQFYFAVSLECKIYFAVSLECKIYFAVSLECKIYFAMEWCVVGWAEIFCTRRHSSE